jgi:hypothetical protein
LHESASDIKQVSRDIVGKVLDVTISGSQNLVQLLEKSIITYDTPAFLVVSRGDDNFLSGLARQLGKPIIRRCKKYIPRQIGEDGEAKLMHITEVIEEKIFDNFGRETELLGLGSYSPVRPGDIDKAIREIAKVEVKDQKKVYKKRIKDLEEKIRRLEALRL